jgi:hypothetical protein
MTEQKLTNELAGLQQKRLDLAAQLDQMALQLQLWDKHIALLKEMLVTLQTQGEQEEKLVQMTAKEVQMAVVTPVLSAIKST